MADASNTPSTRLPDSRLHRLNDGPVRGQGRFVLYWMIAARRTSYNFALDRAIELAKALGKPLVVLEALRCDYRWASDRLHAFVLEGMRDNALAFESTPVHYLPYVEPSTGAGKGLLEALAAEACAVVTDEFPCFFLPRMVRAAAERVAVHMESADSNGLLPLRATERVFARAHDFRRFLQRELPQHLDRGPRARPLMRLELPVLRALPKPLANTWPAAGERELAGDTLGELPLDHSVARCTLRGGAEAGRRTLQRFLRDKLTYYADDRNHPDDDAASGLSPYLHFGHVSAHEVLALLARREEWKPSHVTAGGNGSRSGWWNMSPTAESFLDELVTWRELGYNFSSHRADYDRYESLPEWARATLAEHEDDPRPETYDLETFERAETHDPLWNAAQNQLRHEGFIHNYMRMLWGKKVLHWSESPREALHTLIELNNKYALDGRNPNSYSGIFWIFGRFDRAWGPERPIFGKVRYMTSDSTRRKLRAARYEKRWATAGVNAQAGAPDVCS